MPANARQESEMRKYLDNLNRKGIDYDETDSEEALQDKIYHLRRQVKGSRTLYEIEEDKKEKKKWNKTNERLMNSIDRL